MQDRVPFELVATLIYQQSPEQFAVALEQLLDSIKQERLAETSWTGQEEAAVRAFLKNVIDILCLVGIDKITLANFPKSHIG
jgi:hypothetical protein